MSEIHDKIIAEKEDRISELDSQIQAKKTSLEALKDGLEKQLETTRGVIGSLRNGAHLMDISAELAEAVKKSAEHINTIGNNLLKIMRDTKSAVVFETNQLKQVASDAKHFKDSASDLKIAVELINSIRPTIKELMNNPDELNVIKEIIHACQSTTENRERSPKGTYKPSSSQVDVQIG